MIRDALERAGILARRGNQAMMELEQAGEAFATLKAQYVEAWEATSLKDAEGRERLWQAVQIIGKVESHLIQQVQNGKIAEADIQRLRKG